MKKLLIKMIRLYQKYISPMKRTKCPYIPTCSQYGLEAIEKYGALKGRITCSMENITAVILFLMEDMIPYHKVDEVVSGNCFIRLSRRN